LSSAKTGGGTTLRPTVGAIIRARRIALGYTQETVATAVGWTAAEMVSLVESGHRSPNLDRIPALARKLELDSLELCLVALAESYPILYGAIFGDGKPHARFGASRESAGRA
jgi:transcriptional regulator with XRE-family HTH domain